MNCPSRTDDTLDHPDWNQNPPPLNADLTTRNDFNGIANSKVHRSHVGMGGVAGEGSLSVEPPHQSEDERDVEHVKKTGEVVSAISGCEAQPERSSRTPRQPFRNLIPSSLTSPAQALAKFARFVGPGFLIAVAYIDPGNYATDVAAGADFRYALLFIVLVSNLFAILLQSLCIKLGTVTGLNLAENCREHLPRWVVIILYIFSEAAIVATDIAEVQLSWIGDEAMLNSLGCGVGNCAQSSVEDTSCGRMCNHPRRRPVPAYLLQTQRSHVGVAIVRVLCHGSCTGRRHMLLHTALAHQEPVSR